MEIREWLPAAGAAAFALAAGIIVLRRNWQPSAPGAESPEKRRKPRRAVAVTCGRCHAASEVPRQALVALAPGDRGMLARDFPDSRKAPVAAVPCPVCGAEILLQRGKRAWKVFATRRGMSEESANCSECAAPLRQSPGDRCERCGAHVCARCIQNYTARRSSAEELCPRCGRALHPVPAT